MLFLISTRPWSYVPSFYFFFFFHRISFLYTLFTNFQMTSMFNQLRKWQISKHNQRKVKWKGMAARWQWRQSDLMRTFFIKAEVFLSCGEISEWGICLASTSGDSDSHLSEKKVGLRYQISLCLSKVVPQKLLPKKKSKIMPVPNIQLVYCVHNKLGEPGSSLLLEVIIELIVLKDL